MADGASLLDEELSSFVFSYLTENSGSQYEEEEVSSDRLDVDFPDIDLLQLDTTDFDSVSCLSELHWCHDQQDSSLSSIQYSTGDPELFEIEEENAALLAALTDSLDEMVEDEVGGGLCGFPALGEDPEEEAEEDEEEDDEEEDLPLDSEPFRGLLSPETEDPSLLKKLLLSPPNVPAGLDAQKEGGARRHSNRTQHLKPLRVSVKGDNVKEQKAHTARPAGPQCTELHRFLVTTREAEDTPSGDTEEDSESELEDEEEEDEEEDGDAQESSGSEDECRTAPRLTECQFSSEKELRGMVDLIRYMHTYCLPSRKQCAGERRERECLSAARRPRPDCPQARLLPPVGHKATNQTAAGTRPRLAFIRRREVKGHSLLRELLETVRSFDVSKPYRLQSPPYTHARGAAARPVLDRKAEASASRPVKTELKDSSSKNPADEGALCPAPEANQLDATWKSSSGDASFSVRRSRRLASFPGRFVKKARAGVALSRARAQSDSGWCCKEAGSAKQGRTELSPSEMPSHKDFSRTQKSEDIDLPCSRNEKRSCLSLPLAPKSAGEVQDSNKPFEQTTLSVELCGTAGLTPPTTPPHEPFKAEGRAEVCPRGSWLSRTHSRKLPEQTELYAQLRRMGQAGDGDAMGPTSRAFGDHDYCLQGLGDSLGKIPAMLLSPSQATGKEDEAGLEEGMDCGSDLPQAEPFSSIPDPSPSSRSPQALSPCNADVGADQPPSPSSQLSFSCEKSKMCHEEEQKEKTLDDCQVFYIHNLPSGITQAMLRQRFGALGEPKECKIVVKNEERCGVITIRQPPSGPKLRRRWDSVQHNGGSSTRRFGRKRYIDLDEAGPGPVKSKYDALDFDTLLKEAQRSLHR